MSLFFSFPATTESAHKGRQLVGLPGDLCFHLPAHLCACVSCVPGSVFSWLQECRNGGDSQIITANKYFLVFRSWLSLFPLVGRRLLSPRAPNSYASLNVTSDIPSFTVFPDPSTASWVWTGSVGVPLVGALGWNTRYFGPQGPCCNHASLLPLFWSHFTVENNEIWRGLTPSLWAPF